MDLIEPVRPGFGFFILVPDKSGGKLQTLRDLQTHTVHICDEHQHACQLLTALNDTELVRLLDGVDRILASVGQPNYVGTGGLGLQQIG